jgi:hypothetical protein
MSAMYPIKGFEEVMSNLNREIQGIKQRNMKGLIMSAALVRRDTETTPPLTPVDLGNLRASWFVVTPKSVPVGKGTSMFRGPEASKMMTEHEETVIEAQGMVMAESTAEKQFLIMGYSANYALYVHEMLGVTFQRPGAGPKWFEASVTRNSKKIVEIVRDNAQIGR